MGCGASKRLSTTVTVAISSPPVSQAKFNDENHDMGWLDLQYYDKERTKIKRPNDLEAIMIFPPTSDSKLLNKIRGSLIGLALGDALGAHVEFRPRQYLVDHPVTDLQEGGTWGLIKGQFTDDTSMALCLTCSLISCHDFVPYDQLVRYTWWYRYGHMSSTGECFDIGAATSQSLREFERRQKAFAAKHQIAREEMDHITDSNLLNQFDECCSNPQAAGNGGLMRLAPVPLFFHEYPTEAVEYSGWSAEITHGDEKAYDACRFYGALIVAAIRGQSKKELLDPYFYQKNRKWFGTKPLHEEIENIAKGSYQQKSGGYKDGIRGKGYVVDSLEAALWAFWSDGDSFEKGALAAVNLGDDTDTTAAIYGQLAGAYYGYDKLPKRWVKQVFAAKFISCLSEWITYEGLKWSPQSASTIAHSHSSFRVGPPAAKKQHGKNSQKKTSNKETAGIDSEWD